MTPDHAVRFFAAEASAATTPLRKAQALLDAAAWAARDRDAKPRALKLVEQAEQAVAVHAAGHAGSDERDREATRAARLRLCELFLELDEPERAVEQLVVGSAGLQIGAALLTYHHLFDRQRAMALLSHADQRWPDSAPVTALQLAMHTDAGNALGQIAALERLAKRLGDPTTSARCLLTAAHLELGRGEQREHLQRAATLCRQALALDGQLAATRHLLGQLAEQLGAWNEAADSRAELGRTLGGALRAGLHYRSGVMAYDRLEQPARARAELEEALAEVAAPPSADDTIALWRLAEVQRADGARADLLSTLEALAAVTWDRTRRAELLVEAAELCVRAPLRDDERALEYCEQALVSEPGYLPALRLLGRVSRRRGDLGRLVPIYRREVEALALDERRVLRALECSELSLRVGRFTEAECCLERVLDFDPSNPVAFARLSTLLRARGAWWELARRTSRQLAHARDPRTRAALRRTLAELRDAGTNYPFDPELERDEGPEQHWPAQEGIALYAGAALEALDPDDCGDAAAVAQRQRAVRLRIAALRKRATDSEDSAERSWARVEAARLSVSLARGPGPHREARLREALALLQPLLGEKSEQALGESDADEASPGVEARDDDHAASMLAALELAGRVRSMQGRWRDVLALHERELARVCATEASAGDELAERERALLLCRMAHIRLEHLGEPQRAAELYAEALELQPRCLSAITGVERALAGRRCFAERVVLLEHRANVSSDPVLRADALCRAAELADARLGDPERALALYSTALERCHDARHAALGAHLLLSRLGRTDDLAGMPDSEAELLDTSCAESCGRHVAGVSDLYAATRLEVRGELDEARTRAERAQKRLAGSSLAWVALATVERVLRRAERHEARARVLERANDEADAALLPAPSLRPTVGVRASHAYLDAGDADEALRAAAWAFDHDPDDRGILYSLYHGLEKRQHWPQLIVCLVALAEQCDADANAIALLRRAAELSSLSGDEERELAVSMRALALGDRDAGLLMRAEQLARRVDQPSALNEVLALRIDECDEADEQRALMLARGRLLLETLRVPDAAVDVLNAARVLQPSDPETLGLLTEALHAAERWRECAAHLSTLVDVAPTSGVRFEALRKRATVLLRHLGQLDQAAAAIARARRERPEDLETIVLAFELQLRKGNPEQAQQLVVEGRRVAGPQQTWFLIEVAAVGERQPMDETRRVGWELDAVRLAIGDDARLGAAVRRYRKHGRLRRLVAVGLSLLQNDTLTPDSELRLNLLLGRLLLHDLAQPSSASRLLGSALARYPGHPHAQQLFDLAQKSAVQRAVA